MSDKEKKIPREQFRNSKGLGTAICLEGRVRDSHVDVEHIALRTERVGKVRNRQRESAML